MMIETHKPNRVDNRKLNPVGSTWHRWDPHIHAPGTQKNNNFGNAENVFDQYIEALNACDPPIRALGITDYYVLDSYKKVRANFNAGKLPKLDLLFPNIELRFAVNAAKGSPINVHLLISPEDQDHVEQAERFLRELKFDFNGEDYGCTNDELIRLGRAYKQDVADDVHALKIRVEQSKITPRNLKDAFKKSQWARENILVAIAASGTDGTAQLQEDGLKALREELQRDAAVIFSGNPNDYIYWSGNGADRIDILREKYGGAKPCLHGSDAHSLNEVGRPDQDRYCWIRGDVTFETLRQICFEPERRVHIGLEPPVQGRASDTIQSIDTIKTPWLKTPSIPINSGLVAVIGARGSGKTALVEMIAAGTESVDSRHMKRSFLERAQEYLADATCKLTWGNDEDVISSINVETFDYENNAPRARYLSQQFVDQLCSSDGLADELVEAIEDVIFKAHHPANRLGARSFEELRQIKTQSVQRRMERYSEQLREIGQEISVQDDLKRNLGNLQKKREEERKAIIRFKHDRKALTPTDNKSVLDRLDAVREAAEAKSRKISKLDRRELKLIALKEEAKQFTEDQSKIILGQLKANYIDAELNDEQWSKFKLKHEGDVGSLLDAEIKSVQGLIITERGPTPDETEEPKAEEAVRADPHFDKDTSLATLPYTLLLKEQHRLEVLIGVDKAQRKRYSELSDKIVRAEALLVERNKEITAADGASEKIKELVIQRQSAYQSLVAEIDNEEKILQDLYKPLQDRLDKQEGTLQKLTFSINRQVDVIGWAESGERLFDKSRQGPFRGVGKLTEIIEEQLGPVWVSGSAIEISAAMAKFRAEHSESFWNHAFQDALKTREGRKHWFEQVSDWLYSTNHVNVSYGLEYEGVDIQALSPGTRGIVLLLLYLSVDVDDERPLIIDQPEENLDPKSIYEELVGCFKEAKTRRQIIVVTHNANLVVNTDADQIIVATRGAHKSNSLPDISYSSGGLENPTIRKAVCQILEGGEEAFVERARRLRVRFGQ